MDLVTGLNFFTSKIILKTYDVFLYKGSKIEQKKLSNRSYIQRKEEGREGGRQEKSDKEKNKEEILKVGGRVEWKRGTKDTKKKRHTLPSALEYIFFPEAVLFDS